jgi:hypothetical protein
MSKESKQDFVVVRPYGVCHGVGCGMYVPTASLATLAAIRKVCCRWWDVIQVDSFTTCPSAVLLFRVKNGGCSGLDIGLRKPEVHAVIDVGSKSSGVVLRWYGPVKAQVKESSERQSIERGGVDV